MAEMTKEETAFAAKIDAELAPIDAMHDRLTAENRAGITAGKPCRFCKPGPHRFSTIGVCSDCLSRRT